MHLDFNFRIVESGKDLRDLIDFIAPLNLGYDLRDYNKWIQKTEFQIANGVKTAIVAKTNGSIVAEGIYQQHKSFPWIREWKQARTHPEYRRRGMIRFIENQIAFGLGTEFEAIMGDIRADNKRTINALEKMGYAVSNPIPSIYKDGREDVIVVKGKIPPILRKYFGIIIPARQQSKYL